MSGIKIGSKAIDFSLPATDGNTYSLSSFEKEKALAVIFSCNHCPYVLAWEDRLIDIGTEFKNNGVGFALICANDAENYPEDGFDKMKERVEKKSYPFPYLHDESQETARAYGAQKTPEIFLFDNERKLVYHGAADDNYENPAAVGNHFLRNAIKALLEGKSVPTSETHAVGCTIKWK